MDPLSNVLKTVRLEGAVYISGEFTEPWCIWSEFGLPFVSSKLAQHDHVFFFHFVLEGSCQLRLSDGGDVICASAGDFVLFPQDDRHVIGSDIRLLPVESSNLDVAILKDGGLLEIRHGGGGNMTRFVCGYFAHSKSLKRSFFESLPRVMRVPMGDGPTAELLGNLLRTAVQESSSRQPGSESILTKLSEFIFVEALRAYIRELPGESTGWLAAIRDRQIGRALALLHGNVHRSWTIGELAQEVSLSKSALMQRFTLLVGVPPMKYLKRLRLAVAAQELRDGTEAIIHIAENSGYDSESAFSRAFRREFGMPPAAWRKFAA